MQKFSTITIAFFLLASSSFGQHLYPEKYVGCKLSRFCLDCGDPKAAPPENFIEEIVANLDAKAFRRATGGIEIQIIVDSVGNPCALSSMNQANVRSSKLGLSYAINNTSNWNAALEDSVAKKSSVSLLLRFNKGTLEYDRREFNFKNNTNFKSVGESKVKGSTKANLTVNWEVINQANSDLPWDMSRVMYQDNDNNFWIGTDNGIVKSDGKKMELYSVHNSALKPTAYNKNKAMSIRAGTVDKNNNKWFVAGYSVYRFDNWNWTVYDSLSAPVHWMRKIHVDPSNNVWFTSWKGVSKFDGKDWSVINHEKDGLPSDKTLGVFVDSKSRIWIGTFEGNVRIHEGKMETFENSDSPLNTSFISQGHEDSSGNIWFSLYNEKDSLKGGMAIYKPDGSWELLTHPDQQIFGENTINHFAFDEESGSLWIAVNKIGIVKYDTKLKTWEVYTTQNSNLPSMHVMQLAVDATGEVWGATFAGIVKSTKRKN
jgi:ligand-binding sensor domain-containing protein